jgi:NAD+ diphosphatase
MVGLVVLQQLALSRGTVDRAAHRRSQPDLDAALLERPDTAVLLVVGDQAPVLEDDGRPRLALLPPSQVPPVIRDSAIPIFLGEDEETGRSYLALARRRSPQEVSGRIATGGDQAAGQETDDALPASGVPQPHGLVTEPTPEQAEQSVAQALGRPVEWRDLRRIGPLLDDTQAGLFTTAVALSLWHSRHEYCARCGAPTLPVNTGWARQCPRCSTEHYPRVDPAVIMAVVDDQDRILLGRQAGWPERRFSTLAGFVEPGESLEAAVRREVREEAGVPIGEVSYLGSQPWPFPSSLMVGFLAHALDDEVRVDGVEIAQARWWSRGELLADIAAGEVLLPPTVSIARRLIEHWLGSPVEDDGGTWR